MCRFGKFGHCKYQKDCNMKHFTEVCDSLPRCTNIKSCEKRHPKRCKRFETEEGCRFQEECSYNHQIENKCKDLKEVKEKVDELENKHKDMKDLKDKVDVLENKVTELTNKVVNLEAKKVEPLEKVVKAMCRKVLDLEKQIEDIKINNMSSESAKEPSVSKFEEDKNIENKNKEFNEKCSSSFKDDNMVLSSTPKDSKEVVKDGSKKEELLDCQHCSYKCKKETTLEKHMITKHQEHPCKECKKKFSTFMELLNHVAKYHFQEQGEVQGEGEEIETTGNPLEDKRGTKESDFVFSEFMLDEFLN